MSTAYIRAVLILKIRHMIRRIRSLRKEILLMAALICYSSVITGCSMNQESIDGKDNDEGKVKNTIEDNVKEKKVSYGTYSAKIKDFTTKNNPSDFFPKNSDYKELKDEEIKTGEDKCRRWQDAKKNYLLCENGRISYTSKDYDYIYADLLYDDNGIFRNNFDTTLTDGKVSGITKKSAIDQVKDIAQKNDINVKNAKAYPLTAKNLTKLSKLFMSDKEYKKYISDKTNEPMKRKFEKKDEAYLVVMDVVVENRKLYDQEYKYGKRAYSGSVTWGIVKSKKLVCFEADGIYENISEDKKAISILDEKQAMNKLKQRFEDVISQKVNCNKQRITYIAVKAEKKSNKYTIIPVYLFDITQKFADKKGNKKDKVTLKSTLLLDAETGEWIE